MPIYYTWYTCEIDVDLNGLGTVRIFPTNQHPDPTVTTELTGLPERWLPSVSSSVEVGELYLANVYVGLVEISSEFTDGVGRLVQYKKATDQHALLRAFEYDMKRNLVSEIGPMATLDGRLSYDASPLVSPRQTSTSYAADPLSRQTMIKPPGHGDTDAIRFAYGNSGGADPFHRFRSREDENGRRTTRYFDSNGRHISTLGDSAGIETVTRFSYDAADQLLSTSAPKGDQTTYRFDTIGNMAARHMPDQDDTTYFKYDASGNLRFAQDPRQRLSGLVSYWVYDKYHRNIREGETAADFEGLQGLVSYGTYDFESDDASWVTRRYYDIDFTNSKDSFPIGYLTKVEENTDDDPYPEVVVQLAVDRNGRVFRQDTSVDGLVEKSVTYSYDLAGKITRITYPDGHSVEYAYDSAARIDRITDGHGQVLARYLYGSNGLVDSLFLGEDTTIGSFEYSLRDWTNAIRFPGVFEIRNDFDTVGNIMQQHYRHVGTDESFIANNYSYDGLDRLIGFAQNGIATRQWTYDMNGNSTSRTTGPNTDLFSYEDESAPNRVTSVSGTGDYDYDANGAIVNFENMSLSRDYRGFISGYSDSDQMYKYTVDSEGRRVKKHAQDPAGDTTYYIRGLNGSVLAEYDGNGVMRRSYVYGGTDRIAMIENGTTLFYIRDHLGSTRAILSETGVVLASYDYWPYGQAMAQTGDATQYLFTSHERDGESGLDYMLARMYSPATGRFMRLDPKASALPNLSPYLYSSNNPLKYVDPDGELPHWAVGGVVGGLIGAGIEGYGQYSQGVFDGGALVGAATKGAITGAVAAATFGSSLLTQVGASSTAEVIGGLASRKMSGEGALDSRAIISDAIAGAVGGAAARGAEHIVRIPAVQGGITAAKDVAKDLTSNAAAATFNRTGATAAKVVVEKFGDAVFTQIDDVARKSAGAVRSVIKSGANAASEIIDEEDGQ
ncbi:MAG: RHS repeat-associated core domain-containing protein [Candidatus Latescibacteria bacterium]|nr:RHS repeat-associated core domain-containing protein [Candidatus Latescibacterota bacterium]